MTNHTPTPTTVAEAAEDTEKKAKPLAVEVLPEEDDFSVPVKVGTTCKRRGCGVTYKDEASSRGDGLEATCFHHPGAPIFHEGSKGWSCCPRKVLEFEEFLKIKGCKEGKHLFVGGKSNVCTYCDSMRMYFSVYSNHLYLRAKRKSWLTAEMIGTRLPPISFSAFSQRTRRILRLPLKSNQ
jgi:CHORD